MPVPMLERFPDIDARQRLNAFELAAIVFDEGVRIDHLMCFFADELKTLGRPVAGAVQMPIEEEGAAHASYLDLASGDSWLVRRDFQPADRSWSLDQTVLGQVTQRIKQSVAIRADLAFVPRFGARERAGHGFADAFGTVAAFGVPILTAVHRDDVDAWLRFTGGIGTLLACRLRIVRAWWQETDTRRKRVQARQAADRHQAGGAEVVSLMPDFG